MLCYRINQRRNRRRRRKERNPVKEKESNLQAATAANPHPAATANQVTMIPEGRAKRSVVKK